MRFGGGFILVLAILFRIASPATANLSFLLLAVYASSGRARAVQALGMSWLLTMISPGIAPPAPLGGVGRYAVFLGAFLAVFWRSGVLSGQFKVSKIVASTVALGVFFVVHSLFFSPMPDVSILKAVSWLMVVATLFSAWSGLAYEDRNKLFQQLYFGLVAIMVVSLPLFFMPLGYLRNGSGFQGILNHPQTFGPVMAVLGAIAASKLLAEKKPSWQYLSVFGSALVFVISSEARTAGLALVMGLCLAVVSMAVMPGRRMRSVLPGLRSNRTLCIGGIVLCLGIIFAPQIGEKTSYYISKSGRVGSVGSIAEAYESSRGTLIDRMLSNIKERPLTGIGFGIGSDPEFMDVERDPLFGLPVSAVVEKGVLPIAIVEELGIPGALCVFAWMLWVIRRSANFGVVGVALIWTALLINMGENIFFSPGGLGMLILIVFSWAGSDQGRLSFDSKRLWG